MADVKEFTTEGRNEFFIKVFEHLKNALNAPIITSQVWYIRMWQGFRAQAPYGALSTWPIMNRYSGKKEDKPALEVCLDKLIFTVIDYGEDTSLVIIRDGTPEEVKAYLMEIAPEFSRSNSSLHEVQFMKGLMGKHVGKL